MNTIQVQLTADDLLRICHDLASELNSDMLDAKCDDDDFAGILKCWREQSARYVEESVKRGEIAVARGFAFRCDREDIESRHEMHNETADLLARLIPFLPREEVHRV